MIEPTFKRADAYGYDVSHTCECGRVTRAHVDDSHVFKWRQGTSAQSAFPYLDAATREALFITGTCAHCWGALFDGDLCREF